MVDLAWVKKKEFRLPPFFSLWLVDKRLGFPLRIEAKSSLRRPWKPKREALAESPDPDRLNPVRKGGLGTGVILRRTLPNPRLLPPAEL